MIVTMLVILIMEGHQRIEYEEVMLYLVDNYNYINCIFLAFNINHNLQAPSLLHRYRGYRVRPTIRFCCCCCYCYR